MSPKTGETRRCSRCLEVKPIEEFRLRSRATGARACDCRLCHNEYERVRRASKRTGTRSNEIFRWATAVKRQRDDRRLGLLVQGMIARLGGVDAFADLWVQEMRSAMSQRDGWRRSLDCFVAILRLAGEYDRRCTPQPLGAGEPDMATLRDLVTRHPELVLAAASELGWSVIPAYRGERTNDGTACQFH